MARFKFLARCLQSLRDHLAVCCESNNNEHWTHHSNLVRKWRYISYKNRRRLLLLLALSVFLLLLGYNLVTSDIYLHQVYGVYYTFKPYLQYQLFYVVKTADSQSQRPQVGAVQVLHRHDRIQYV